MNGEHAVITVQRGHRAWRDLLRGYQVLIDEKPVGSLEDGMTQRFLVEPGPHSVRVKIDWCSSRSVDVDVAPGQEETFECVANGNPISSLYFITLGRKNYLRLDRITGS